jgi:hypothetical protein
LASRRARDRPGEVDDVEIEMDGVRVLPAIIVTQTLVALLSELVYVRFMPKIGKEAEAQRA